MIMYSSWLLIPLLVMSATVKTENPIVDTLYGPVRGVTRDKVNEWHQVPYGQCSRWKAPETPKPWTDPLDCTGAASGTGYSIGCSQICGLPPIACPNVTQEDCLFLNIYTPQQIDELLPVMLFIHGGSFKNGFGDGPLYNGTSLSVRNDLVVITINYRLGALGFLNSGDGNITGDFGFLDQQEAIRWTHSNIQNFGGDPNDITLFGQSAGAQSVTIHSLIQETKNLGVTKFISQSNPFGLPLRTPETWKSLYTSLLKAAKCEDATCLRELPVEQLLSAQKEAETTLDFSAMLNMFEPWTPTAGGKLLPDQPLSMYQKGIPNHAPIIHGVVSEEARMFIYEAFPNAVSSFEYSLYTIAIFGSSVGQQILKQYPLPSGVNDARDTMCNLVNDGLFHCPNLNATLSISSLPVWFYEFNHVMSFFGNGSFGDFIPSCEGHVCHQEELVFVFYPSKEEILQKIGSTYNADEELLAQRMGSYWGNFAKKGDPTTGDPHQPLKWPLMGNDEAMIEFNIPDKIQYNAYTEKCTFWNNLGYEWLSSAYKW